MSIDPCEQYDKLIQVLQLMASDYCEQISFFPKFVIVADEIALLFDDTLTCLSIIQQYNYINEEQKNKIWDINNILDKMSNDKSIWSLEALKESREWQVIRKLSSELLISMGLKKKKADLYWINFYKASE